MSNLLIGFIIGFFGIWLENNDNKKKRWAQCQKVNKVEDVSSFR